MSERAWKVDSSSSKMFIDPRVPVSISDLLHGLMIQSGNDAAVAIAEAVAGDEATFVTLMNREAQRLGLKSTRFANPHGLPDANNYSTAADLANLASHVIRDFPSSTRSTRSSSSRTTRSPSRTATACCGSIRPSTA